MSAQSEPLQHCTTTSELPWYRQVSRAAWWALALGGLGWLFESYDSFMLSLTLPVLSNEFSLSKPEIGGLISLTAAGQIIGGIAFGHVSDRIGRVRAAYSCILIYSIFSGLIAFSPTITWLSTLRFCGALGMGGTWTAGAALVAESWGPQLRGRGGAFMQMGLPLGAMLAIAASAIVGSFYSGLVGNGWRILYLIGVLPALLLAPVAMLTPESAIWIARRAEAAANPKTGARQLIPPGARRNALLAFGIVFCLQYVYWGVFTWTPTFLATVKHYDFLKSLTFVLALQLGAVTGFLVFGAFVDRLGRKPMFMAYIVVGILAVAAYAFGPAATLVAAIFFSGLAVNGIFAGMGPFTAEMIPDTPARGFVMGLIYNGGRLGGLLAPSIIGQIASGQGGIEAGLGTTVCAFIVALSIVLCVPETRGRSLR
jgi:MFS family permease